VERFDDTTINASLDTKLGGWPDEANLMQFRLNRITGGAELDYLQKPTKTDPWPGFLVMEAFSERGTCSRSERAF
jgi:hypothetical protein